MRIGSSKMHPNACALGWDSDDVKHVKLNPASLYWHGFKFASCLPMTDDGHHLKDHQRSVQGPNSASKASLHTSWSRSQLPHSEVRCLSTQRCDDVIHDFVSIPQRILVFLVWHCVLCSPVTLEVLAQVRYGRWASQNAGPTPVCSACAQRVLLAGFYQFLFILTTMTNSWNDTDW